ncbi:MAG: portal protein [Chloroflexi bacterium RBG_16_58_14]|nr:MAG: portal protein [Chloroflexi bacterium RBG_16_58_14]
MNIIVIGCGRVGAELAYRLFKQGHRVTVLDYNEAAFHNLPHDFRGRTIVGEALNQNVLLRAGVEHADGLAAVTNSDTVNAVVAHAVRTAYGLQNIVVRNFDPLWRPLFEVYNLQVISSTSWGAQRMEEMLYHAELRTVFSAGNGEVEIYEVNIPASLHGQPASSLQASTGECRLVGLTRAGKAMLPDADTILETGDVLLVSATLQGIQPLREQLKPQEV